jgi:hypothetical protein
LLLSIGIFFPLNRPLNPVISLQIHLTKASEIQIKNLRSKWNLITYLRLIKEGKSTVLTVEVQTIYGLIALRAPRHNALHLRDLNQKI